MALNSPTLQKLLNEYNKTSIIYDFQKLISKTDKNCVEPDLEYIKSIDSSICTLLCENIRYVQYIIYSLYDSKELQNFKFNLIKYSRSEGYHLLLIYEKLIEELINNNVKHNIISNDKYAKYIDKLKIVNSNICLLIDKIKNITNNTSLSNINRCLKYVYLSNIYEHDLCVSLNKQKISNIINNSYQNNKDFLIFSVNKKTKQLDYIIESDHDSSIVQIINNTKIRNAYINNKNSLANIELQHITIKGQYNSKFELLKFPQNFFDTYNNILSIDFITRQNILNFQNDNTKYLDLKKYNVYIFKLNKFQNKHTKYYNITYNSILRGFYNFNYNNIYNLNFDNNMLFLTSNSVSLIKGTIYVLKLLDKGDNIIENKNLLTLFTEEVIKLLEYLSAVDKQHTFKYDGQFYLIMNIINNTFIKLNKQGLNEKDIIKIIKYLKVFNTKFVNITTII